MSEKDFIYDPYEKKPSISLIGFIIIIIINLCLGILAAYAIQNNSLVINPTKQPAVYETIDYDVENFHQNLKEVSKLRDNQNNVFNSNLEKLNTYIDSCQTELNKLYEKPKFVDDDKLLQTRLQSNIANARAKEAEYQMYLYGNILLRQEDSILNSWLIKTNITKPVEIIFQTNQILVNDKL